MTTMPGEGKRSPRRNCLTTILATAFLGSATVLIMTIMVRSDPAIRHLSFTASPAGQPDWDWLLAKKRAFYRGRVKPNVDALLPPGLELPDMPQYRHIDATMWRLVTARLTLLPNSVAFKLNTLSRRPEPVGRSGKPTFYRENPHRANSRHEPDSPPQPSPHVVNASWISQGSDTDADHNAGSLDCVLPQHLPGDSISSETHRSFVGDESGATLHTLPERAALTAAIRSWHGYNGNEVHTESSPPAKTGRGSRHAGICPP
jgi:hypothetical protein